MTLDRTPFFIYFFSLLLLLILLKNFRKLISISIFLIGLFFIIAYKNNDLIHYRYKPVFYAAKIISSEIFIFKNQDENTYDEKKYEDLREKIIL